jgi:hypothetical protein
VGEGLWSAGVKVALVAATVLLLGFIVVAVVADVPLERRGASPSWPGEGFVLVVGVGIVGMASLVDAVRDGRSRRRSSSSAGRSDPG